MKKEKICILKNNYNSDILHTTNYNEIESTTNGIDFIRVFNPENPQRTFLVNRSAYKIVNK